ncbi:hypothetical protein Tco_1210827 [Tanacetum coccineum]
MPTSISRLRKDHRKLQLNELSELRDQAYENSLIYKERKTTKALHRSKLRIESSMLPNCSIPKGSNFKSQCHRVEALYGVDYTPLVSGSPNFP